MQKYEHLKIEKRWQRNWDRKKLFVAQNSGHKPKFYCLIEFPYPSGDGLHVGHPRSYVALDILSRKKRMDGFNVLYPIGWDAFGLPAENYAIKTGQPPAKVVATNIQRFKKQIQQLGISFDWSREINTTDPAYYKWTQWIFLQLYKHGLAYKKKMPINWCPSCKIGLANEEVVDNKCERCGALAEQKELGQWMLKITAYADRLIDDLETVDYQERIKTQQVNWIGRSEGAEIKFQIPNPKFQINSKSKIQNFNSELEIRVFTTRPDTLFGATFLVLAPEHELVNQITTPEQREEVVAYQEEARKKNAFEKTQLQKEKTGVFTGAYAINPATKKEIPIWIADYVGMDYGTGAIMAVPAHDERDFAFAKKFDLPIVQVIAGLPAPRSAKALRGGEQAGGDISKEAYVDVDKGEMINSGEFNGLSVQEMIKRITVWLEKEGLGKKTVNYHLRDWVFSRQHYWGEPIPMVNCEKCGWVPLSEKELPLKLPKVEKYQPTGTGESPLAAITKWVNTKCQKCGGKARRETDTMPNWAGSSWYFLRYIDPKNKKALADFNKLKYWLPIDLYNGGMEHTTLHLLYSRFWHKFLFDIGAVPTSEPYQRRISHGMILASDGQKMSKSRGNVITPDEIVKEYGADVLRLYEMFIGPYEQTAIWDLNGVKGVRRFLERIYHFENWKDVDDATTLSLLNKTIAKVGADIDSRDFNTAVSAMMIFVNKIVGDGCTRQTFKKFLTILSPFAPHLGEELWQKLGSKKSICLEKWPELDEALIKDEQVEIVVQINGKVRARLQVATDISEEEIKKLALENEKVREFLAGVTPKKVIYVKGRLISIVI